jgi:hypothetical protein
VGFLGAHAALLYQSPEDRIVEIVDVGCNIVE